MGKRRTIINNRKDGQRHTMKQYDITVEDEMNVSLHKKTTRTKSEPGSTDKRYTPGIELDKESRHNYPIQDHGYNPGGREAIRSFSRTK